MPQCIKVPELGVGQVEGVREYALGAMRRLCERNQITGTKRQELMSAFREALTVCENALKDDLSSPMTHSLPEGRKLWNALGDVLVDEDSVLHGKQHLDEAFEAMREGANVLLIQNHTSGADTLLMETVIRREYGEDVFCDVAYMSGHAVNLFLIPYLVTSGLNRFQIFSAKYKSRATSGDGIVQETGADEKEMNARNLQSMRALSRYSKVGGRMIGLYPEGGRGENGLKTGECATVCIPEIMSKSDKPLFVLPTYVSGATSILPVHRTDNEYNESFELLVRGSGELHVGPLVPWSSISALADINGTAQKAVANHLSFEQSEDGSKSAKMAIMMSLIAHLAKQGRKGAYAHTDFAQLVTDLI